MHKVMLVEDDTTMLSLVRTFLEIEGYEVVDLSRSEDLGEFLEFVRREKPDLIMLDVHLSELSGFDLLRGIRQDAGLKPTRVLMCSGMDLGMQSYAEGADNFILKPYMPEELVGKIRQILGE